MPEKDQVPSIIERIKTDKDILNFARRIKATFFSSLAFFLIFVILAGFGLPIAYIAHLIVNVGDSRPERFAIPKWVRPVESLSVGVFILALLVLAAAEPWKDAYRYFRYGNIEPDETTEAVEIEDVKTPVTEIGRSDEASDSGSDANPANVNSNVNRSPSRSQSARKNRRGRRH